MAAAVTNDTSRARLCLKARPTPRQLADRLRPVDGVWPEGLELYLAAADLVNQREIEDRIQVARQQAPEGFAWLIEGPVDSLDGADFDVTRQSGADDLVIDRLADLAERIQARAVNIHVIAPGEDVGRLTLQCRAELLERSLPFLERFVERVSAAGAVPTVENMPPVLRMRRADFAFTPIGMASADLLWLAERIDGLRIMPDTSHAGLYLNARSERPGDEYVWTEPLRAYLRQLPPEADDLLGYVSSFGSLVANAQVSNASGLLGEGLAYAEGDFNLDPPIRWLGQHAEHIVTETLEADNDDAVGMRDALRRMRAVLA